MPQRIQRKRTKGWKMPPNTVYVGRPTKWGNPYVPDVYDERGRRECVSEYRKHFWRQNGRWHFDISELDITELRGKDLACWCPLDQPCHADILLEIANS
jgi:hypothetical protein